MRGEQNTSREAPDGCRKIIVTGGAGVIGQAICRRLLQSGYLPIAADLREAIDALPSDDPALEGTISLELDVTDPESVEPAIASVLDEGENSRVW